MIFCFPAWTQCIKDTIGSVQNDKTVEKYLKFFLTTEIEQRKVIKNGRSIKKTRKTDLQKKGKKK